jgi:hypothetical protein
VENEGGVGREGVAEESLGLGDKMETVGKNGLGVNWPVSGDEVEGLFSRSWWLFGASDGEKG